MKRAKTDNGTFCAINEAETKTKKRQHGNRRENQ